MSSGSMIQLLNEKQALQGLDILPGLPPVVRNSRAIELVDTVEAADVIKRTGPFLNRNQYEFETTFEADRLSRSSSFVGSSWRHSGKASLSVKKFGMKGAASLAVEVEGEKEQRRDSLRSGSVEKKMVVSRLEAELTMAEWSIGSGDYVPSPALEDALNELYTKMDESMEVFDEASYDLFGKFGSHIPERGVLGGIFTMEAKLTSTLSSMSVQERRAVSTALSRSVEASASFKGWGVKAKASYESDESATSQSDQAFEASVNSFQSQTTIEVSSIGGNAAHAGASDSSFTVWIDTFSADADEDNHQFWAVLDRSGTDMIRLWELVGDVSTGLLSNVTKQQREEFAARLEGSWVRRMLHFFPRDIVGKNSGINTEDFLFEFLGNIDYDRLVDSASLQAAASSEFIDGFRLSDDIEDILRPVESGEEVYLFNGNGEEDSPLKAVAVAWKWYYNGRAIFDRYLQTGRVRKDESPLDDQTLVFNPKVGGPQQVVMKEGWRLVKNYDGETGDWEGTYHIVTTNQYGPEKASLSNAQLGAGRTFALAMPRSSFRSLDDHPPLADVEFLPPNAGGFTIFKGNATNKIPIEDFERQSFLLHLQDQENNAFSISPKNAADLVMIRLPWTETGISKPTWGKSGRGVEYGKTFKMDFVGFVPRTDILRGRRATALYGDRTDIRYTKENMLWYISDLHTALEELSAEERPFIGCTSNPQELERCATHEFRYAPTFLTFHQHRQEAAKQNCQLASVRGVEEMNYLLDSTIPDLAAAIDMGVEVHDGNLVASKAFVGAYRVKSGDNVQPADQFEWLDGTCFAPVAAMWEPNQPNSQTENVLQLGLTESALKQVKSYRALSSTATDGSFLVMGQNFAKARAGAKPVFPSNGKNQLLRGSISIKDLSLQLVTVNGGSMSIVNDVPKGSQGRMTIEYKGPNGKRNNQGSAFVVKESAKTVSPACWIRASVWIKFINQVPPPSDGFGFDIQGTIVNGWVQGMRPNVWKQVTTTQRCGNTSFVRLTFDSIVTAQTIRFSDFRVDVLNGNPERETAGVVKGFNDVRDSEKLPAVYQCGCDSL